MILPHMGNMVEAGINDKALAYNVPLVRSEIKAPGWDFGPLYLQAVKLSEDGKQVVFRLSEQDGRRGEIGLPFRAAALNMLEDVEEGAEGSSDRLSYHPFELLTIGVALDEFLKGIRSIGEKKDRRQ